MSAPLRELLIFFGTEVDTKPLEKADDLVNTLKKGVMALAAGWSFNALVGQFKAVADTADDIADTSAKLGFSTEALQKWRYVAKLVGIEAGALDGALRKANMAIAGASKSAEGAASFKALGVSLQDVNGQARATEDIFSDAISSLAAIEDRQKRAALASELFGKSFTELNPLLDQGAEGIEKLKSELAANGGLISASDIAAAGEMNDQLDKLDFAVTGLKSRILGALAPALTTAIEAFVRVVAKTQEWTASFKQWLKESQPLRNAIRFVATLLGVVATKAAPGLLLKGITMFAGKWAAVGGFIGRALLVLGRFIMRMLIPALLLDDLIVTFRGGDSVIRRILDGWFGEGMTKKVTDFFAEVTATKTGTVAALGVMVAAFTSFGRSVVLSLAQVAIAGASAMVPFLPWIAVIAGITAGVYLLGDAFGGWAKIVDDFAYFFEDVWGRIKNSAFDTWDDIVRFITDKIAAITNLVSNIPGLGDLGAGGAQVGALASAPVMATATRTIGSAVAAGAMTASTMAPTVNVTVPPGTPATMAQRVGAASARGTQQGMKAASRATKQKAP